MGFTKNRYAQVATSPEQIESGNRYPDSVEVDITTRARQFGRCFWRYVSRVYGYVIVGCMTALYFGVIIWVLYDDLSHHGAPYSFEKNVVFNNEMKTNEYGISYYVPSRGRFDKKYPVGTPARAEFEKYHVVKDYIEMEQEECKKETTWKNNYVAQESFPACDKLREMGLNPYPKV